MTDREIFLEVYEDNPEIPYGSVPKNLPSHYISDGASKQIRASRKLLTSVLSKSKEQQIQTDESQDPLKGLASDPLNFLTKVLSQHMTPAGDNDQELNKLSNCCRACLDDFGTNDLNCVFEGESLTDTFFNCTSIKVKLKR